MRDTAAASELEYAEFHTGCGIDCRIDGESMRSGTRLFQQIRQQVEFLFIFSFSRIALIIIYIRSVSLSDTNVLTAHWDFMKNEPVAFLPC